MNCGEPQHRGGIVTCSREKNHPPDSHVGFHLGSTHVWPVQVSANKKEKE